MTVVDSAGQSSSQVQHVTIFGTGSDLIAEIDCSLADPYVELTQQCQLIALDKLNQISRVRVAWGDGTANNLTLNSPNGIFKPSHKYASAGNFNITLTVTTTRGEVKSAVISRALTNFVPSTPTAVLSCSQNLLTVTCSTSGSSDLKYKTLSYTFDWGDGTSETTFEPTVSHVYSQENSYVVKLAATNSAGYSGFTSQSIRVYSTFLRASLYCEVNNLLVTCNAFGSTDLNGNIPLSFKFTYGDGFEETTASYLSTHAFSQAGLYNVKMEITNSVGEKAFAETQVMTVVPPNEIPQLKLSCSSPSPQTLVCNSYGSNDTDGQIFSYKYVWDDEEENITSNQDPITHVFSTAGLHKVKLIGLDNDGGLNTIEYSFDVLKNNPPIANMICFSPGPQRVHCDSLSEENDPGDQIIFYEWDMGNGEKLVSLIPSVDYTYNYSSQFEISLSVSDRLGIKAETSVSLSTLENRAPVAIFNCSQQNEISYLCNSGAYDSDGKISSIRWQVDGMNFSGDSIMISFSRGGDFPLTMTVVDDLQKEAVYTSVLHIDLPKIGFTCSPVEELTYQCLSSGISAVDENDPIVSINYIVDNKDVLPGENMEYDFNSFGKHNIQLQVKTISGKTSSLNQTITLEPRYLKPFAEFIEDVQMDKTVLFDASLSEQTGRRVIEYSWDFGDGNSQVSLTPTITHQFNSYGWHDIKLRVLDNKGAYNESVTPIFVYDPEVPLPGDDGFSTVEGVDSDRDGVRDDVQRWINKNSFESDVTKKAFRYLASVYKNQLVNLNSVEILKELENAKFEAETCVNNEILSDYGVSKSAEFETIYLNTNDRVLMYSGVLDKLSGYTPQSKISDLDPCAKWKYR